ncbi:hypothetical protein ANCDUO_22005 [Ancylostoma duodenale]|uniref:SXP/RAL-2 family protein Ani s 5-like cation-binding domain-containing protein n=1 Tax=Ancylostoma duodenale TaxID=51022 RepID=A0A0C2FH91_9BILA|nr:hypothetical protein ANCDUO_22005 [Ancylostoma duodenale]
MNYILIAVVIFGVTLCGAYHDHDWHHGHHGQHGHHEHHRHYAPPFLKNVSKEGKKEYYEILKKHNATIAEQKAEILEWAKKFNVEEQVKAFEEKKHKEEVRKNVEALLAELPAFHKKFTDIIDNENQTHAEMRDKIEALRTEKPKEFAVMTYAARYFRRHHKRHIKGHHGRHGKD